MKLYFCEVDVGNYYIRVVGKTPEECKKALVHEYKRVFGSFQSNGFENAEDWMEYHGIDGNYGVTEITVGKAWTD